MAEVTVEEGPPSTPMVAPHRAPGIPRVNDLRDPRGSTPGISRFSGLPTAKTKSARDVPHKKVEGGVALHIHRCRRRSTNSGATGISVSIVDKLDIKPEHAPSKGPKGTDVWHPIAK